MGGQSLVFDLKLVDIRLITVDIPGNPFDRPVQALIQGHGRSPTQAPARQAVIGDQAQHFRLFGAQAFRSDDDLDRPAQLSNDHIRQVPNPNVLTNPQVEHAAFDPLFFCSANETGHGILHIGEITRGIQAAQVERAAGEGLADDGWDDRTGGLARAVGIERADGYDRQGIGAIKTFHHFIGPDLAGRIGRLPLQRMRFRYGDLAGGAIHLAGGSMDQALHAEVAAGQQNIQGPHEIRFGHFQRMDIGIRDGDGCAQMENDLAARQRSPDSLRIPQIPGDRFDAGESFRGEQAQQAGVAREL